MEDGTTTVSFGDCVYVCSMYVCRKYRGTVLYSTYIRTYMRLDWIDSRVTI